MPKKTIHLFYTNGETGLTAYRNLQVEDDLLATCEGPTTDHFPANTTQPWHVAGDLSHMQVITAGVLPIEYGDPSNPEVVELREGDIGVWQDNSLPGHRAVTGAPLEDGIDWAAQSSHYILANPIDPFADVA